MKIKYKFLAGLLTCSLALATFLSPIQANATTAEALKEAERLTYYNKEIESNGLPGWPQGPQIYADSAIVMEASTGIILYSKDMDKAQYPASITKIMTALLALENCSLDEPMTYSYYATHSIEAGSSSIGTTEGEILTVEQSLYALLLESANECGNGLAEHVSGSVEAFAELMNQRAAELGCTNTHFVNPHGLHDDNHYTSAHDMALITREAIKNETFVTISGTGRYDMPPTNKDDEITYMRNHHNMIYPYRTDKFVDETVIAGKTGGTSAALNTLVTVAERNGMTLIVVTMRTHSTDEKGVPICPDTALLLDYATDNFHKVNIAANETNFSMENSSFFPTGSSIFGSSQALIEVNPEGYLILPNDASFSDVSPTLEFQNDASNPNVVAKLSYTYNGQPVGETTIDLAEGAIREFDFDKETGEESATDSEESDSYLSEEAEDQPQEKRFIKINVKLVLLLFVILVLIILLIFLIRKKRKQRRYRSRYGTPTGRTPKGRRRRRRSLLGRRRSSYDRNSSVRYHRTPKIRSNHSKFNL